MFDSYLQGLTVLNLYTKSKIRKLLTSFNRQGAQGISYTNFRDTWVVRGSRSTAPDRFLHISYFNSIGQESLSNHMNRKYSNLYFSRCLRTHYTSFDCSFNRNFQKSALKSGDHFTTHSSSGSSQDMANSQAKFFEKA